MSHKVAPDPDTIRKDAPPSRPSRPQRPSKEAAATSSPTSSAVDDAWDVPLEKKETVEQLKGSLESQRTKFEHSAPPSRPNKPELSPRSPVELLPEITVAPDAPKEKEGGLVEITAVEKQELTTAPEPVLNVAVVQEPKTPKPDGSKAGGFNSDGKNTVVDALDEDSLRAQAQLTGSKNTSRTPTEFFFDCVRCALELFKNGTRRILRICIVTILIAQTIYLPVSFVLVDWYGQVEVSAILKSTETIFLGLTDSSLVFMPDSALKTGQINVSATTGGFRGCIMQHDIRENSVNVVNCDLYVQYSLTMSLPSIHISTINGDRKTISNLPTEALLFNTDSQLNITGNNVDIFLSNIHVGNDGLNIDIKAGSIQIENLNASRIDPGLSMGFLKSYGGDVLVTTAESLQIDYKHPESSYCFAAANVSVISEQCTVKDEKVGNANKSAVSTTSGAGNDPVVSCEGSSVLCDSVDVGNCARVLAPRLAMMTIDGSLYATVEKSFVVQIAGDNKEFDAKEVGLASATQTVIDEAQNISNGTTPALYLQKGFEMSNGPIFSKVASFEVQQAKSSFLENPDGHHYVIFDVRAPGLLQNDKFIFTNIPVYLVAEPWLMRTLSALIISPAVTQVTGRIKAAVCPYRGSLNGRNKLDISNFIKQELGSEASTDVVGFKTYDVNFLETSIGAPWQLMYTYSTDGNGLLESNEILFSNYMGLILTIGMSFVLALFVCVVGAYKIIMFATGIARDFFKEIELVNSMAKLKKLTSSPEYQDARYTDDYLKRKAIAAAKLANGEMEKENKQLKIPFPFALPEMALDIKRRSILNSLEDFLDHHAVKVMPHEKPSSFRNVTPLEKFKEVYETYCFSERLQLKPLSSCQKTLTKFGIKVKTVFDGTTDSVLRIRFCSQKESVQRKELQPLPNEDSLSYFVRKHCVVSAYDSDSLLFREFTRRYENERKFADDELGAVPVTKRAMRKLGVIYKRLTLKHVEFSTFKLGETNYRVDLNTMNSTVSLMDEFEDGDIAEVASAVLQNGLTYDLMVSAIHWLVVMALGIPSVVVPLLICSMQDESSSLPENYRVTKFDATNWSYAFGKKLANGRMPLFLYAIFIAGWVCTAVLLCELICYFCFQPFDLVALSRGEATGVRKIWIRLVYFCMAWCILLWVWYIGLALSWMILGCLVNPNEYLPYAAAAATFLVFASAKVGSAMLIFSKAYEVVLKIVRKTFSSKVVSMMKMLALTEKANAANSNSQDPAHMKAISLVENDKSLVNILKASGIDLTLAVGLSKGTVSDIEEAAEAYGMSFGLMYAIVACARKDKNSIAKAVHEISAVEGMEASQETLRVLFQLTQSQDDQTLRFSMKESIIHALNVNKGVSQVSPHQVESVVSVGRGCIGRIVDICNELAKSELPGTKRVKSVSGFLELLRNDMNSDVTFATDWASMASEVCQLPKKIAQGIAQIRLGQCRGKNVNELATALQVPPFALKLLVAIAKDSPNEFRINGPGAKVFSEYIEHNYGIQFDPIDLLGITAIARSTLIETDTLARVHGVSMEAADAIGHLMAQERGAGNVQLGLNMKENCGHLQWLSYHTKIRAPVLAGLFSIAGCRLGEAAVQSNVNATVSDFTRKLNLDDRDEPISEIIFCLLTLTCSMDRKSIERAVECLGREKVIKAKFAPLILFTRGLMGPYEFFDRSTSYYKTCLGMNYRLVKKYLRPKSWYFESNNVKEPMSDVLWGKMDERRSTYISVTAQYTMKYGSGSSIKHARDILFIESKFPKAVENYFQNINLGNDVISSIKSLFFLGQAPKLKSRMDEQRIYQQCSRVYNLEVPVFKGLMQIGYADHRIIPGEVYKSPVLLRGEALCKVFDKFDHVEESERSGLKNFVNDFVMVEGSARRAMVAAPKLAVRLQQPEFSNIVVVRDHEAGFGASASGDIDDHFDGVLQRFLLSGGVVRGSQLEIGMKALVAQDHKGIGSMAHCMGMAPSLLTLASRLFGENTTSGMVTAVGDALEIVSGARQSSQKQSSKKRKTKKKKPEPKYAIYSWQPEPLGPPKMVFDAFVLILSLVYCVITPYRMFSETETTTDTFITGEGIWLYVDLVGDFIFILDVLLGFITPFSLDSGEFVAEVDKIAFLYIKSWFFPDVAASIPFALIELVGFRTTDGAKNLKMLKVFKGFRLLKLLRVIRLRKTMKTLKILADRLAYGDHKPTPLDQARAFASYMAEANDEFKLDVQHGTNAVSWKRPSDILAQLSGVNMKMVEGLLHIKKNEQDAVRNCILSLVNASVIPIEETLCRGLTSLATGGVDSIEDMAAMLGLDEDTCEGLSFIASSVTVNIKLPELSSSGSLHKICSKLGLDLLVVSALLAIVNQDYMSGEAIDKQLSLVAVDSRYLKAMLCAYSNDVPHSPRQKTDALKTCFGPLISLFGVSKDHELFAAFVRLVQGDCTTIRKEIGDKLGLSKQEREILCSLVLICQQDHESQPYFSRKVLDFSPSESTDWDATRDAGVCAKNISRVYNMSQRSLSALISAARGDVASIEKLAKYGIGKTVKETRKRLALAGGVSEGDLPDDEEDEEEDIAEDGEDEAVEDDDDSIASSQMSSLSQSSTMSRGGSVTMGLTAASRTAETYQLLAANLNSEFPPATDEVPVDAETVEFLLHLCHGNYSDSNRFSGLKNFSRKMQNLEQSAGGTPAITYPIIKELLALAMGMYENWEPELFEKWSQEGFSEHDSDTYEIGMFEQCGLDMTRDYIAITFLSMFGQGLHSTWELKINGSVVSSKIHPDTRLIQAFAALASNNADSIALTLPALCEALATDNDLVSAIISIAIGDESRMQKDVDGLANRVNADGAFAQAFIAGASLSYDFVCDRLNPMASKLGVSPDIAACVILATQCQGECSIEAWVKLCHLIVKLEDEDLPTVDENDDPRYFFIPCLAGMLLNDDAVLTKWGPVFDEMMGWEEETEFIKETTKFNDVVDAGSSLPSITSLLHAIANNNMVVLSDFLALCGVKGDDVQLMCSLVDIFNRSFSGAQLEAIDNALYLHFKSDKNFNYPQGLFTVFGASLNGELDVFASGMENFLRHGSALPYTYMPGFSSMMVSLMRRDGNTNREHFDNLIERLSDKTFNRRKTLGREKLVAIARKNTQFTFQSVFGAKDRLDKTKTVEHGMTEKKAYNKKDMYQLLYSLVIGDVKLLLPVIHLLGIERGLAGDILVIINKDLRDVVGGALYSSGQDQMMETLASTLVRSNPSAFPQKDTVKNLALILSNGFNGVGGSRGLSTPLEELAREFLTESADKDVLSTVLLASTDSPSHMDKIFRNLDGMLTLVLRSSSLDPVVSKLVKGLVGLWAPTDSAESQTKALGRAFIDLSKCFKISPIVLKAVYGLVRGKMDFVRNLGEELGEFDTLAVENLFFLIMRLAPVVNSGGGQIQAEEEEEEEVFFDEEAESVSPAVVFARVDRDKSGYITLDEFEEAMKIYQLSLNPMGTLKLFLDGSDDVHESGLLSPDDFERIVERFETNMVTNIMNSLGKGISTLMGAVGIAVVVLLVLFGFLFLGIGTFSTAGAFNAGTSGGLFMGLGNALGDEGDEEEEEEGDDENGGNEDIHLAILDNIEMVEG